MAPDVTVEEVARLARAMSLKNAAASLPHGGAKAGIVADPMMPVTDKEATVRLVRAVDSRPGPVHPRARRRTGQEPHPTGDALAAIARA